MLIDSFSTSFHGGIKGTKEEANVLIAINMGCLARKDTGEIHTPSIP
jgi:hypothetical protein